MTSENACKEKLSDSFSIFAIEMLNVFFMGFNRKLELLPLDDKLYTLLIYIFIFIWLAIIAIEIKRKNYKCYYAYIFAICNICYLLTR